MSDASSPRDAGDTSSGSDASGAEAQAQALAARLWSHAKPDPQGLISAVVIDRRGGDLRMVGYMNQEALEATLVRQRVVFFSRSKQRLWEKGESSGNSLLLHELRVDCDGDAIACYVDAKGPTCHTGARSCFFRRLENAGLRFDDGPAQQDPSPAPAQEPTRATQTSQPPKRAGDQHSLARVFAVIEDRKAGRGSTNRDGKSYVRSLLDKGAPKINSKIAEEAMELCSAIRAEGEEAVAKEAADLIFHAMVGMSFRGLKFTALEAVFDERFGVSGIDEKAARKPGDTGAPDAHDPHSDGPDRD